MTPPVGTAMFAVCHILKCPISEYTREGIPYCAVIMAEVVILAYVPEIVMFLPDLVFGK
jgi:TRAP-type C4-dicarboxylate transport system permease large subunit